MRNLRYTAAVLVGLMTFSLTGCGGGTINAESQPGGPMGQTAPMGQPEQRRPGLSNKQKVLLLAGAAAVYYMYQKHKNKQGEGAQGRYYRSKNGRVYYRDLKTGKYQWVDPPSQPIQVPAADYERYTGRSVDSYGDRVIQEAPPEWSNPAYR